MSLVCHPRGVAIAALVLTAAAARADRLATGTPASTFTLSSYVTGLGQVTDMRFLPDGRLVVVEKAGAVRVWVPSGPTTGTLVNAGSFPVDTASEKGLLGVEVHPQFAANNTLFFYYSRSGTAATDPGTNLDRHRVVSVVLRANSTLDLATEAILVRGLRGPANHDGGALAIGPDGKLYIGVGDTGCNSGLFAEPPYTPTNYFGTCLTNGNGKILRVNLDGSIPIDNPLVNVAQATACGACTTDIATTGLAAPRTDIWAWGLRNPWRIWFDPMTGNLWVADVGERTYEEISLVAGNQHYGWPWREGDRGWATSRCTNVTPNVGNCVDPIYVCVHNAAPLALQTGYDVNCQSINGGLIVDHCSWPASYRGQYYFGDNANGRIWSLKLNAARNGVDTTGGSARADFAFIESGAGPITFQVGPDGALYVGAYPYDVGGRVIRIAPTSPVSCLTPDAGTPDDAGPRSDAGRSDAGAPEDGGAVPGLDAGAGDAGDGGAKPGCGCAGVGAGGLGAAFLLALVAWRRRSP